ncbi:MAG TPA: hypothetical protein VMT32_17720 [Bryobacteraceae bacterium]|nr:hypothetical protein [Bryobacteraceae bacterium]
MSTVAVLFLVLDAVMKFVKPGPVAQASAHSGAVAIHLRVGRSLLSTSCFQPTWVRWGGLSLREAPVRELIPLKR